MTVQYYNVDLNIYIKMVPTLFFKIKKKIITYYYIANNQIVTLYRYISGNNR